ncbi:MULTISPECIES: nucleotidyl transferase AbiEii/AbiGii toxin family protein [Pediococcus]|uniref:nucleotidyl transferase AbiEii/AbiGii toxin family protein n=1 Tax=Pediococcus TaxID=1253 RepID=UPI0007111B39|nr:MULTISPECIES: nucleotidyl transferase AbiEii/AbiGii toxin family protein [Pediococcus]AVL00179.1 hypothetical protein PI20285_05730 [Pediococcus inopinatus]KRN61810.1 hypothetical protein IV83_GL000515 [Pediococcus inopinatus]PIO80355.1 hypothetical protein BSQ38_01090 [Pediococcus damnosus]
MTPNKFKDWSKKRAKETQTPITIVQRDYILDEVLKRIANSEYRNNLVFKGGFYVQSLLGTNSRTTEDLDTTLIHKKNSEKEVMSFIQNTLSGTSEEGIIFSDFKIDDTREEAEYPGFRIRGGAFIGKTRIPFKMDITTGDAIVPSPIVHEHKLMFDNRSLKILAYPIEQVIAEKLQTILSRSENNSRSKDFYDITLIQKKMKIDYKSLFVAFQATCKKRNTNFTSKQIMTRLERIKHSPRVNKYWQQYVSKPENHYAKDLSFSDVMDATNKLFTEMNLNNKRPDSSLEKGVSRLHFDPLNQSKRR